MSGHRRTVTPFRRSPRQCLNATADAASLAAPAACRDSSVATAEPGSRIGEGASPPQALAEIERLIREAVARTLAAADGDGVMPLAAAFRAGREFLAESGAEDELLDEIFA